MAAAATGPHFLALTGTSSSTSSTQSATPTQNHSSFSGNSNQGIRHSLAIYSKSKDLCRNASLDLSTFVGSPMMRALQRPVNEHRTRSVLWISAQSVSNGASNNSVAVSLKTTTKAVADEVDVPAVPENSSKTTKLFSHVFNLIKTWLTFVLQSVSNGPSNNSVAVSSKTTTKAVADEVDVPAVRENSSKTTKLFIHVSNLIKLVNSRDIVELQLKHKNYELLIRKEAALPSPPPPAAPSLPQFYPGPHVMAHTPFPMVPHAAPTAVSPPADAPVQEIAAIPPVPKQDFPPMLSPMAGTFYRSPGPGEPSFVKVGDKVQKGQVVCIVEAMKLMNEIEADQSGTITEILVEDKNGVSIDTPLFIIKP